MTLSLAHVRTQLPNGLVALVVPMPAVHRVVLDAHVRVGPRFETEEQTGISHFLEHMLYRGTPSRPSAHEQAFAFERLGGSLGAATYIDHGTMGIAMPPKNFAAVLELFADVYQNPIFAGIDVEKGIVREEILESLDEEGVEIDADNLIRALCFAPHPLGRPITGTLDHVASFDVPALREHHRRFYVGRGTVLCVAGPVDPDAVLNRISDVFGSLEPGEVAQLTPPPSQAEPRFRYVKHTSSQTALRVGFRAPAERHALEPATDMLLRLIDDGMSTRLYHRVCDLRGLCYDVSAGYEAYQDSGLVELAAETAHERAQSVLEELLGVVRQLRDEGPEAAELDKARQRCTWQLEESLDEPGEIAEYFAFGELMQVDGNPADRLERLLEVTPAQIREAAATVFCPSGLNVVAVGVLPKKTREALERAVRDFS